MKKKYLECGKIVSTHGLRGDVRVQHWCDDPMYFCDFSALYIDGGEKKFTVERARPQKNIVLLKLSGIDDIDAAVTLRGKILYIDREDAPDDGADFIQDLLGMEVRDADSGEVYGELSDVFNTGANDVYEITAPGGKKLLAPAIPDVVKSIDYENEVILITPLKGLFSDED